jgi:hypothetical protein
MSISSKESSHLMSNFPEEDIGKINEIGLKLFNIKCS